MTFEAKPFTPDSPLEELFGPVLARVLFERFSSREDVHVTLVPQARVQYRSERYDTRKRSVPRRHRVDFLLYAKGADFAAALAVECDGAAFHGDSEAEAFRDALLWEHMRWRAMHFTGSELYRDRNGCAERAAAELERMHRDRDASEPAALAVVEQSREAANALAKEFIAKLKGHK